MVSVLFDEEFEVIKATDNIDRSSVADRMHDSSCGFMELNDTISAHFLVDCGTSVNILL